MADEGRSTIMQEQSKSSIDIKQIAIQSGSSIAVFWLIDKMLQSDNGSYTELLKIGLVGAAGLTVVTPIINNLLNGVSIFNGIIFDKALLYRMLVTGGLSAVLYYIFRYLFSERIDESTMNKYIAVIVSVLGASALEPWLLSKWNTA